MKGSTFGETSHVGAAEKYIIKLSTKFGVDFKGCEKKAKELFLKIDNNNQHNKDLQLTTWELKGDQYTWRKGDRQDIAARLDRFLISEELDNSDHSPIMLQCGEWKASSSHFKFENWWLQTEGFKEKIKTWWESFPSTGSPDFVLVSKLRALKTKLKEWSKSTQGNLGIRKQLALAQLEDLEEIQEPRILQEEEVRPDRGAISQELYASWTYKKLMMLVRMGFVARWIRWIKHCIGTVRFSILVNRVPTAMEGTNNLINTTKGKGGSMGSKQENFLNTRRQGGEHPTTYLGMPLGAKSKSKGIWNGVRRNVKRDSPIGRVSTCPWVEYDFN
ncbi:hypothetical protein H5410_016772 [Solanum commersonii]|uniref:Uncharacterized protein n=1 Tax=Solanum commersonii TaxID=4109 RepID=A0A9J5ZYD0_SOLCO|nr:hypothetical protein H5410_016772 [Solanum commersonii]